MSGGQFDYYHIKDFCQNLEEEFAAGSCDEFSKETIQTLHKGLKVMQAAFVYAHRIDYLLSGDDGEETFNERLKDELDELIDTIKITKEIINAGKSINGGWSKKQLELLGVYRTTIGFPKGWLRKLIGKEFDKSLIDEFIALKDKHLIKDKR